jgi:hypothetical protein
MGSGSGLRAIKAFSQKNILSFERCSASSPNSTGPVDLDPGRQNRPTKKKGVLNLFKKYILQTEECMVCMYFYLQPKSRVFYNFFMLIKKEYRIARKAHKSHRTIDVICVPYVLFCILYSEEILYRLLKRFVTWVWPWRRRRS